MLKPNRYLSYSFMAVVNDGYLPNLETLSIFIRNIIKGSHGKKTPFLPNALSTVRTLLLREEHVLEQHVLDAASEVETLFCCGTNLDLVNHTMLKHLKIETNAFIDYTGDKQKNLLKMLQPVKTSLLSLRFQNIITPTDVFPTFPNVAELYIDKCEFQGVGSLACCFPSLKILHMDRCESYQNANAVSDLLRQVLKREQDGLKFLLINFSCFNKLSVHNICEKMPSELPFPLHINIGNSFDKLESIVNVNTKYLIVSGAWHLSVNNGWQKVSLPKLWKTLSRMECEKDKKGTIEFRGFNCTNRLTDIGKQYFLPAIQYLERSWEFVKFSNCEVRKCNVMVKSQLLKDNVGPFFLKNYRYTKTLNLSSGKP